MTDKVLNLIFKVTDKASKDLKEIEGGATGDRGIGGIKNSLAGLVQPATMAAGSLVAVGAGVKQMMDGWAEHVREVSDFNAMINGTIEETSVLIEISKDYGITQDTLLASMRMLASQGIEPNIEGLIKVRGMLNETTNAADRLKLAQELLGEQGIKQLIPMLNQLTDEELRAYNDTLTDSERITADMEKKMMDYTLAVQALDDMFSNLKMTVAGWAAPGLTAFLELIMRPITPGSIGQFVKDFAGAGAVVPWTTYEVVRQPISAPYVAPVTGGTRQFGPVVPYDPSRDVRPGGIGHHHGGEFYVGGFGGPDSQRVSFAATPGEKVRVGGTEGELVAEVRRLVNSLPIMLRDAVERT